MKVRWGRDSVRLRITPMELATLTRGGEVAEDLRFPGGACWRVAVGAGTQTDLSSQSGVAQIALSPADRERLAQPDAEGVYFQTPDGLRYYLEKDFPCAHPRAAEAREPATETFAAPQGFEERLETETEINGD